MGCTILKRKIKSNLQFIYSQEILCNYLKKEGFSIDDVMSIWNQKWELHFVKTNIRANIFFLNEESYSCITYESVEELNSQEVTLIDILIE